MNTKACKTLRPCEHLYALPETIECALHGCTPCSYKLVVKAPTELDGVQIVPKCRPNERPEQCPRMNSGRNDVGQQSLKRLGLYTSEHRILVVGDGDFSFSRHLAQALFPKESESGYLLATSFQSGEEVRSIYPSAVNNIKKIQREDNAIEHQVDAKQLCSYSWSTSKFDRIIFNFPCVPVEKGQDGQTAELEANRLLTSIFLQEAVKLLSPCGEVHIVHKTKAPFSWWKIPELPGYLRSVVFDRSLFPLYVPRKVHDKKSFPVTDAVTHIFGTQNTIAEIDEGPLCLDLVRKHERDNTLVRLTTARLKQIVHLLQLAKRKGCSGSNMQDFKKVKAHFPHPKRKKKRRKRG